MKIPGVGKSIANDLTQIGIRKIEDLKNQSPEQMFEASNKVAGVYRTGVCCMCFDVQFILPKLQQSCRKKKS